MNWAEKNAAAAADGRVTHILNEYLQPICDVENMNTLQQLLQTSVGGGWGTACADCVAVQARATVEEYKRYGRKFKIDEADQFKHLQIASWDELFSILVSGGETYDKRTHELDS